MMMRKMKMKSYKIEKTPFGIIMSSHKECKNGSIIDKEILLFDDIKKINNEIYIMIKNNNYLITNKNDLKMMIIKGKKHNVEITLEIFQFIVEYFEKKYKISL